MDLVIRSLLASVAAVAIGGCTLLFQPGTPEDGGPSDAAPDGDSRGSGDATDCPEGCTDCDRVQKTCRVDCSEALCPMGASVECPPGWSCTIDCLGSGSCADGVVSCTGGGSCHIVCLGVAACEAAVVSCDGAFCEVICDGADTCDMGGVFCDATACSVTCRGSNACEDCGVCCAGGDCGGQCEASQGGNCNCGSCEPPA